MAPYTDKMSSCLFIYKSINSTAIVVLVLIQAFFWTTRASTSISFYKAAVVEFSPDKWNGFEKPEDLLLRNAKRFAQLIEEAGREKCDIIVFPEFSLTTIQMPIVKEKMYPFLTLIPNAEDNSIPCQEANNVKIAQHLREISCAAAKHKIYVVINIYEKQKCDLTQPDCPSDGLLVYNTNAIFDREGKIIAKYNKFNLYEESQVNKKSSAEMVTFDTDFGVKFGTFICFDIMFNEPSVLLIKETGVSNIIFTSAWISELPFLTAVQVQAGYSYLHNVNLLSSGYSEPNRGFTGSGIYGGNKGPLVTTMSEKAATRLLIATLPSDPARYQVERSQCGKDYTCKQPEPKTIEIKFKDDFYAAENKAGFSLYHEDLSDYVTEVLQASEIDAEGNSDNSEHKQTFTYNKDNFNCKIYVRWTKSKDHSSEGPIYRLVGSVSNREKLGIPKFEACGLIACLNKDIKTCGYRPNFKTSSSTNITSLVIETSTSYISNPLPSTLDKNMMSLLDNDASFTNSVDKKTGIQSNFMALEKPHNDLITFGIYKF